MAKSAGETWCPGAARAESDASVAREGTAESIWAENAHGVDRGERQCEVRVRQTRDDFPLERLVMSDGARPVGGTHQQRECELSGTRPAVTPSESVRRMAGHGERHSLGLSRALAT